MPTKKGSNHWMVAQLRDGAWIISVCLLVCLSCLAGCCWFLVAYPGHLGHPPLQDAARYSRTGPGQCEVARVIPPPLKHQVVALLEQVVQQHTVLDIGNREIDEFKGWLFFMVLNHDLFMVMRRHCFTHARREPWYQTWEYHQHKL